ncbi:HTH-type transcriptional regulator GbpR [compost metagenome]
MEWTQRLRIRQLTILVELHRTQNVSHAAEALCMTQPALSKWLADFEGELGVTLFERLPKGMAPTPCCDALVVHARNILAEIARTEEALDLMASGARGVLAIGATHGVAASLVPVAIASFRQRFPDVRITLADGVLQHLVTGLREGRLDVVVGRMDGRVSCQELVYEVLCEESVRVIAGPGHPLAALDSVSWADTRAYGWIGLPPGSQLRSELEYEFAVAAQPPPRVCVETAALLATLALVQHDTLLAAASGRVAARFGERGYVVTLPLPYAGTGNVGLLTRADDEASAPRQAFMACVRLASGPPGP